MAEDRSIIDIDDALKRALGDVAFLKMMFDELMQTLPDYLDPIQTAIQNGDMELLNKSAHQFKGATANLGARGVSEAAFKLEKIGKSGMSIEADAAYADLCTAMEAFRQCWSEIDWSSFME